MTPSIGRIVHYTPKTDIAAHSNGCGGDDPVAAIITRVWSDELVNLTVFRDAALPIERTSVQHADSAQPDQARWDWPPRV